MLTCSEAYSHLLDSVRQSDNTIDFDLEDLNTISSLKSFGIFCVFMKKKYVLANLFKTIANWLVIFLTVLVTCLTFYMTCSSFNWSSIMCHFA